MLAAKRRLPCRGDEKCCRMHGKEDGEHEEEEGGRGFGGVAGAVDRHGCGRGGSASTTAAATSAVGLKSYSCAAV